MFFVEVPAIRAVLRHPAAGQRRIVKHFRDRAHGHLPPGLRPPDYQSVSASGQLPERFPPYSGGGHQGIPATQPDVEARAVFRCLDLDKHPA